MGDGHATMIPSPIRARERQIPRRDASLDRRAAHGADALAPV
jgi:hypothetical protein